MRSRRRLLVCLLTGGLVVGCTSDRSPAPGVTDSSSAAASSAADSAIAVRLANSALTLSPARSGATGTAPTSHPMTGMATTGAGAGNGALSGPPRLPGTRWGDTVKNAGGLLLGLPEGWVAHGEHDSFDVASYTLGGLVRASACYRAGSGLLPVGQPADAGQLRELATIVRVASATWGEPAPVRIGAAGYPGRLVRGRGQGLTEAEGTREVFAVELEVPGRRPIVFVGAWMDRYPEHEEQLRDMLRALQPCLFKPGHGCALVTPTAPASGSPAARLRPPE